MVEGCSSPPPLHWRPWPGLSLCTRGPQRGQGPGPAAGVIPASSVSSRSLSSQTLARVGEDMFPQNSPVCVDGNLAVQEGGSGRSNVLMAGSPVRVLLVKITGFHCIRALKKHRFHGPKDALPKTRLRRNSFPTPITQEGKHTYNQSNEVWKAEEGGQGRGFIQFLPGHPWRPFERPRPGLA